jgi:hypothetical protein
VSEPIDIFEASAFRPTSNGYVLRVPNFWMFGKSRHYLASEAQKNEIVARVKRARRVSLLLTFLLWLLVFAGFVTGMAFLTGHDDPTVADVIAMIVFALVSLLLFLHFWYVLLIEPSLRHLVPTEDRTSFAERRAALRAAMRRNTPSGHFLRAAVLFSLSACFALYSYLLTTHGGRPSILGNGGGFASLFAAVMCAVAAALFFYREIRNSGPEAEAPAARPAESDAAMPDARLERLRSDHNQLRRSVAIVAAAVALTAVGAIILNGMVRNLDADRLILRNGKGDIAAMFAVGKDGSPSLGLYGPDQKMRAVFGLSSAGAPILRLNGPDGEGRLSFVLADDGSPNLQLAGADGKSRIVLTAHGSNPGVVFFDAAGAIKLRIAVDPNGVPIRIFNASTTPIKVFDANGKEVSAAK